MKGRIHRCLNLEVSLGISYMFSYVLVHILERSEEIGKDALIYLHENIVRITYVEGNRAIICVNNGLNGVSDIVETLIERIGIRDIL